MLGNYRKLHEKTVNCPKQFCKKQIIVLYLLLGNELETIRDILMEILEHLPAFSHILNLGRNLVTFKKLTFFMCRILHELCKS